MDICVRSTDGSNFSNISAATMAQYTVQLHGEFRDRNASGDALLQWLCFPLLIIARCVTKVIPLLMLGLGLKCQTLTPTFYMYFLVSQNRIEILKTVKANFQCFKIPTF